MKTKHVFRTVLVLVALVAAVLFRPTIARAAGADTFTFTDEEITTTAADGTYTISGTTLSITANGTYTLTGSCAEGSVSVAKNLEVTLILDDFSLTSTTTAPIAVKKTANVTIHLEGDSMLADNEADSTNEDFEGACIKVKSGSTVTFCGPGNLTCVANGKNAIKGGAETALVFNQTGTITVTGNTSGYAFTAGSINNGIAADGSVTINSGIFMIYAANDGIKSDPDVETDTEGNVTVDTASEGKVTINGGEITILCDGDAIHADTALIVNGGTILIQTMKGYKTTGTKYISGKTSSTKYEFVADDMSAKGLKAGGERAEDQGITPEINITGGYIGINSADDSVHSDGDVTITGGTLELLSGDDGVHAETTLTSGVRGNKLSVRDPEITVYVSYEGLEGTDVIIYSGRYSIKAKDDGINAAGGSSQGTDPWGPGGGEWPWGGGGGFPRNLTAGPGGGNYSITVYNGTIYVECDGDGLDSNGSLNLYGGVIGVFSMYKTNGDMNDNSALDADGSRIIQGAYVFTAGAQGVDGTARASWFGSNQKYKTMSGSFAKGTVLNVTLGGTLLSSITLPKAAGYVMYSAPNLSSTPSISRGSYTPCKGGSYTHTFDEGVVTTEPTETSTGVKTFTCTACGETETQTIPAQVHIDECDHIAETSGYTATFVGEGFSINVYYTQDYTTPSETGVRTAIARDSATGEIDDSGNGQINFAIVLKDGYSITGVDVEGQFKNKKDISDELDNGWRITKVASDLTITISTSLCEHKSVTADDLEWNILSSKPTVTFHCNDCDGDFVVTPTVTSELSEEDGTITVYGTVTIGEQTFTNTITVDPFVATFEGDEGVESFTVYFTKDYTEPSLTNATATIARDGDTGDIVVNGDGQINFAVVLKDGYAISEVTATKGAYKNIKDIGSDLANGYRITKVTGDLTITVTTVPCTDISDATVTAAKQLYTGEAIEPEVTVTLSDGTVLGAADYDVAYSDNTNAGTATITVTGKGLYTGTATGSFEIYKSGWAPYEGTYCYIEEDGSLRCNGWAEWKGTYYYFGEDGKLMKEGLAPYEPTGKLYHIKNYVVVKGWAVIDGAYYYFGDDYAAYTNQWIKYGGAYYYFGEDSKLVVNGWGYYEDKTYYLGADGTPVVNTTIEIDGVEYTFGADGALVSPSTGD